MAWFKGTATDWLDMIDIISTIGGDEHMSAVTIYNGGSGHAIGDIISLASGTYDHDPELEVLTVGSGDIVASIASIGAGGTGYSVGDLIQVDGGTATQAAILEVTTVSGGVVTGLQVNNPGIYSAQPSNPVATTAITGTGDDALTVNLNWTTSVSGIVTSIYITDAGAASATPTSPVSTTSTGSGTGLTLSPTWTETAWTTDMNFSPQEAASATVAAGGTGYSVGDTITAVGGTYSEVSTFLVATESAGVVTSVTVAADGYYSSTPSNPVTTSSSEGGSGCTLNITWKDYDSSSTNSEQHMIMHNTVEDVYIGIRGLNYTSTDGDVWNLQTFTGFNTISTKFWEQPGYDSEGCWVPLHDASFTYYLNITNRRIVGIFNIGSGSCYSNMYLGLIDPFMTETEYPYPAMTLGCISSPQKYTYSSLFGGLPNPGAISSSHYGPARVRMPDGSTSTFRNWVVSLGNPAVDNSTPGLQPHTNQYNTPQSASAQWYFNQTLTSWNTIVQWAQTDLSSTEKLKRINNEYLLVPLRAADPTRYRLLGTLSDVYWFDNYDGELTPGDRLWVNGVAYRAFPNCKLSNKNNYFCVKEG